MSDVAGVSGVVGVAGVARRRRGRAWLLLVCAVGALLWWGRVVRPVEVEVSYAVPLEARAHLRHLSLTWTAAGDGAPAVEGQVRVPPYGGLAVHTQSLSLRPGRYTVTARFEYADGTARAVEVEAVISRDTPRLSLSLPTP